MTLKRIDGHEEILKGGLPRKRDRKPDHVTEGEGYM